MAYDTEVGQARYEYDADRGMRFRNAAPRGSDLETIMTLLEVAALSLTTEPGATFTIDQLIAEAREIGGAGLSLSGRDIKIVFEKAQTSFLEKSGREFRLK